MKLKVGLCYNLLEDFPVKENDPDDIAIEWCDPDYIALLREGIAGAGMEVSDIGDPLNLNDAAVRAEIDIVFSVAEMLGYRYREILVPALCELYGIPYLFARPDAMLITADKHLSNLIVERLGIAVPAWQLVSTAAAFVPGSLSFPLIIKPNAEGSSMGISDETVIFDENSLKTKLPVMLAQYRQPVMIQEFVNGAEYTVGIIQDQGKTLSLSPLQVFDQAQVTTRTFDRKLKAAYKKEALFHPVSDRLLKKELQTLAASIFDGIGCADAGRIDFRVKDGTLYFLEINGLTDFHPGGAFCQSAASAGIGYHNLLEKIIINAYRRSKSF